MRITRDILLKAARTAVQQRTMRDRHIVCVYLTGSLTDDLPLLGGTADIDLIFVHDHVPDQPREIMRLTPDVHLDLAHHDQSIYNQPRELRLNPWVGSYLVEDPIVLYSSQHWFEYVQATVFSKFYEVESVIGRAMPLAESARQTWLDFQLDPQDPDPKRIWLYLQAIEHGANALAVLNGPPLTERRFLLQYQERVGELGFPGMAGGLSDLLANSLPDEAVFAEWQKQWQASLALVGKKEDCPLALHPIRFGYYTRAVEALASDRMDAALWIVLRTWTQAILCLPEEKEARANWQEKLSQIGMQGAAFQERLNSFDLYLDQVEEIIEKWAQRNGLDLNAPIEAV
jgi:hypothetical protein